MKFQIISLFILFIFSNCTVTLTSITDPSCTSSTFSFKLKGTTTADLEKDVAVVLTISSPTPAPTVACENGAVTVDTSSNVEFSCSIASASLSNAKLTITGATIASAEATISSALSLTDLYCPINTLTVESKTEGSCADNKYTFTVVGQVAIATSGITTWTPTFSAPSNPTASCSMPAVSNAATAGAAVITCTITSALSNSDITLTTLKANGFTDVTLGDSHKAIATGKTCEGSANNNNNDNVNNGDGKGNGSEFISLKGILLSFLLFFI